MGAYVIYLDEYESIECHWIPLYVNGNNIIYFNSLGVEHIPKEIRKFIGNKNIITNIFNKIFYILSFVVSKENLKNIKYHIFWKNHSFYYFAVSVKMKMKKYLKKKNQLRY